MNLAVLSLTRDRLDYTKHCFQTLRDNAGCHYDHFVLDQASTDGTVEWLNEQDDLDVIFASENIGISRGLNVLLAECCRPIDYDVIVKFDNDCELLQPGTLATIAELACLGDALLSPHINGLRNPPAGHGVFEIRGEAILDVPQIGGIFLAAPATVYDEFRYDDHAPVWGTDDTLICRWHRQQGGRVGYVNRFSANHYLSTDGQHADLPWYFERKRLEGCV